MSLPPGPVVRGILRVLEADGPMTRTELARALNVDRSIVSSTLSRMNRKQKTVPRRVYVAHYQFDSEDGERTYPRAAYAIGDKPNAKKVVMSASEVSARYRHGVKHRLTSVFDLAIPQRERMARTKPLRGGTP